MWRRLVLLSLSGSLGCSEMTGGPRDGRLLPQRPGLADPDPIVAFELNPGILRAFVGHATGFILEGITRSGQRLPIAGVRWTSSAPEVATVDSATGVITTVAPGRATIRAQRLSLQAEAVLIVTVLCRGPSLALIGPGTNRVGEQGQWTARVSTCVQAPGQSVRWRAEDTTIVRVTLEGHATAHRVGVTAVTAILEPHGSAVSTVATVVP